MLHRYHGKHAIARAVRALSVRARIGIAITTLAALSVTGLAMSGPASATALLRCNTWGPVITIKGVGVHEGTFCGNVYGSGNYVSSVSDSFTAYTTVCNWNITAEFFRDLPNGGNAWTYTINGPVHHSCTLATANNVITVNSNEQTGFVCSTLKENGTRLTSWCASIHP